MFVVDRFALLLRHSVPSACELFFPPPFVFALYLDCAVTVFTRPAPTTCSRSSICTSSSSGLFRCLTGLHFLEYQSSIDLSQIDFALSIQRLASYAHCWKKQGLCSCSRYWTPTEALQSSHFTLLHVRDYRRRVVLQHASLSLLWIPTQLPSIQSPRNLPGMILPVLYPPPRSPSGLRGQSEDNPRKVRPVRGQSEDNPRKVRPV